MQPEADCVDCLNENNTINRKPVLASYDGIISSYDKSVQRLLTLLLSKMIGSVCHFNNYFSTIFNSKQSTVNT